MVKDFAAKYNLPAFRLQQFNEQFFQQAVTDFLQISSWPKDLRTRLAAEVPFMSLSPEKELVSKDKRTVKVLFRRNIDSQRIETVLMRHKDGRNTVCVSCMVGCPVNCSFCATGKMGFGGNLKAEEIVDQVMYFQRYLKSLGQQVTNVVFMGMGEPMLNLDAVQEAINTFTDPEKLALSKRRITISTSGYIPQFNKLIADGFRGRVAISLHAPNQELREKLMPVAKIFSLDQLMEALDKFVELTNKRVTYEYVMIRGVNDKKIHAWQLVKLFKKRLSHINLIPYNPIQEVEFARSGTDAIAVFRKILRENGISCTVRVTMGDDVNAACGQLADRENKKNLDKKIR